MEATKFGPKFIGRFQRVSAGFAVTAQVLPYIVPSVATEVGSVRAAPERDTHMLKKLKAPLTAILLSSVAVVPAATVSYVATADAAFAKSDNAGSKGNSGNKGGGKGKGASKNKFKGGKSAGRGGSGGKVGLGLNKFINKLTGRDKSSNRSASNRLAKDEPMHPSNLGNMNGALHANENAIAAHIRNGNTNGPVGLMAAYVSSRATTENTIEELGEGAGYYIELNDALAKYNYLDEDGNPSLEEYEKSGKTNLEVEAALDKISWSEQERLLAENGYLDGDGNPDLAAYEKSVTEIAGFDEASTEANSFDEELYADVNETGDNLAAAGDAEQALIDYWNKQDTAPEGTEEALRAALDARASELEETSVVSDALTEPEAASEAEPGTEEASKCSEGDAECDTGEEVASATE